MSLRIIMFCFFISIAGVVEAAARRPIPQEQWSPQVRVWLAQGVIGEAGWLAERDHVAIAYVLVRRWRQMQKRWPSLQFRDVLFRYAKALGGGRREFTSRQLWIRSLTPDLSEPGHWPRKASWKRHRPLWAATLARVDAWARGELRDPCRGLARHWGGVNLVSDLPKGRMVAIDCGETKNIFYDLSGN